MNSVLSSPLKLRQDLEENLFNNNSKCEDCGKCNSAYVHHRSMGVFDKSSDEAMI